MERKIDRVLYYFCRLFGVTRNKMYLVYPNSQCERIYMKMIPTIIHKRKENKDYGVVSIIGEPINKTMTYYYIKIEELSNNLNNKI